MTSSTTTTPAGPRKLALPVFTENFKHAAHEASHDQVLLAALDGSIVKRDYARRAALAADLPDADALRTLAGDIKRHTLDNLDYYLEQFEKNVAAAGGTVHYANTADEANALTVALAQAAGCRLAVKSKSMVSEETELNHALEAAGIEPLETDLGEFILQVDHDHPSHLVMPVIHKRAADIGRTFEKYFSAPFSADPQVLAEMARVYLRKRFNEADLGISGVNFAIAATGSIVLCTNEGNGRMCTSRPRVHIALMGMEKMIPALEDLPVFLKLLARSATGQPLTQYSSIITGPRRAGELDGPEALHIIIIDNGRSRILGSDYRDTLRCIRCGACLNACPIYRNVGGHTYGSVYPGPIGALITPLFNTLEMHKDLPQASSLCGACYEACPVKINIPEMLIHMKGDLVRGGISSRWEKLLFYAWTLSLRYRWTYRAGQVMQRFVLRRASGRDGWIRRIPGPAAGWTAERDFPRPAAQDFRTLWKQRQRAAAGPHGTREPHDA